MEALSTAERRNVSTIEVRSPENQNGLREAADLGLVAKGDFIETCVYRIGRTETPLRWARWAAIGCLAGVCSNRVIWDPGESSYPRIYPNLMVYLIGPPGDGKDHALNNTMNGVIRAAIGNNRLDGPDIRLIEEATPQVIMDKIMFPLDDNGELPNGASKSGRIFCVTPELANGIPTGELGQKWVSLVVDLFTRVEQVKYETIGRGSFKTTERPAFTHLAGTTADWLTRNIQGSEFGGGLGRRILPIFSEADPKIAFWNPFAPADHAEVNARLQAKVAAIMAIPKEQWSIGYSDGANAELKKWYESIKDETPHPTHLRDRPHPQLNSIIKQEDAWVRKFSMLVAVSEWEPETPMPTLVTPEQAVRALDLWYAVRPQYTTLLEEAGIAQEENDAKIAMYVINKEMGKKHNTLQHTAFNTGWHHHWSGRKRPSRDVLNERRDKALVYLWEQGKVILAGKNGAHIASSVFMVGSKLPPGFEEIRVIED